MKVAALQMVTSTRWDANRDQAWALLQQAAQAGAELAVLPEYFCLMGHKDTDKLALAEPLGHGPMQQFLADSARERDSELINAGKEYVTLIKGGSFFHHGDSFAMMRGGHIDLCVLGAFQVAANGDLANWHTGAADAIPAVGGAMDLAVGAKEVYVTMEHTTKTGAPKIVETCRYPLTGMACVNRIYTDLAVIDITPQGLLVREMVEGLDLAELQNHTEAKLQDGR